MGLVGVSHWKDALWAANHTLSSLDAVGAGYFRFLTTEWSGDAIGVFLTRGYDLERWLLKMLCCLVVSGNATFDGKRLPTWTPPMEWLEILFGSADVEAPAGLHCIAGNYRAAFRRKSHSTLPLKGS